MVDLGTFLISNGMCTPRQLEEALRNQIIFGGQLGTVLFELGYVNEENLAMYLGRKYNLPALHGLDIQCDPDAVALLSDEAAQRLEVIPYRVKDRLLEVLCMDPSNLHHLDEAAFITGMRIKPLVVTEFRFWYLLQQLYGIRHQIRYIDLGGMDPKKPDSPTNPKEKPLVTTTENGELMSELDFTRFYHQVDNYHEISLEQELTKIAKLDESVYELTETADSEPGSTTTPLSEPSEIPFLDEQFIQALPPDTSLGAELPQKQPIYEQPEEPIYSFAQARQQLDQAAGRDMIAKIIMRFALSQFSRVMLFTAQRQMVSGWLGMGEHVSNQQVEKLRIPLTEPSVFLTVTQTRAHFLGSLQKSPLNIEFLRNTGKIVPLSVFVLPILVRGQVVNLLYADNGHKQHCSHNIGELLILAQRMGQSYEELIQRKITDFLQSS